MIKNIKGIELKLFHDIFINPKLRSILLTRIQLRGHSEEEEAVYA